MEASAAELRDVIRAEFGLAVSDIAAGGRGALGQIWRLRVEDGSSFAVKLLAREPSESLVAMEVTHTREMRRHGVRVAESIANRHGRYVSPVVGGWLRVSEWIDGTRPDPADPLTPLRLGDVLGRMHAHAVPMPNKQESWYCAPPDIAAFGRLIAAAERNDPRWAGRLDAFLPILDGLSRIRKVPVPLSLVLCHRDLHPENVLLTREGQFAILDWDNLGPADPAQELASVLLHWFADRTGVQASLVKPFIEAYRSAGGTGTLTAIDDFAMHIAANLNFLALQLNAVANPRTEGAAKQRALIEIEESLQLLPATDLLAQYLSQST